MCLESLRCQNKRVENKLKCKECLTQMYDSRKKIRVLSSDKGLCTKCKRNEYLESQRNKPDGTEKVCQTCYLQHLSMRYFDSRDCWKQLLEMLVKQDFKCIYSGETIILGENDALDHISPKKRFPERVNDITNVHWTTREVNMMKYALDEQRFFDLLIKITENCKRLL